MPDDRNLISPAQLAALRQTLRSPTVYTQRLVEHLKFLPTGGQHWQRDLQLLIPEVGGVDPNQDHLYIVSLGIFRRRRIPDFSVSDCNGRQLNLLTRVQHGHCLSHITIDQYLTDEERTKVSNGIAKDPVGKLAKAYAGLYQLTFDMFTSVSEALAPLAEQRLVELLQLLNSPREAAAARAKLFMEDMKALSRVTQYLCWVRGRPNNAVRVTATYTMKDPVRLEAPRRSKVEEKSLFKRVQSRFRAWCSEQYSRLGLGPIPYDIVTPANGHAASYYFTIEPPPESDIAYMDWGLDNSYGDGRDEWVCAHHSVHVHNGATLLGPEEGPAERTEIPESKIHAFARLDPADHKQVVVAALLNIVFIWLAEAGRLTSELGGTSTPWLAFTPAVLIAYVAQQRRHYYAGSTGRIRAVIWGYLLLNVIFLISISFDIASDGSLVNRSGFTDDFVSSVMAASSIAVATLFLFVGSGYEFFVRHAFRRVRRRKKERDNEVEPTVSTYVRVARWYGNLAVGVTVLLLAIATAVVLTGHGPHHADPPRQANGASKGPHQHQGGRDRALSISASSNMHQPPGGRPK